MKSYVIIEINGEFNGQCQKIKATLRLKNNKRNIFSTTYKAEFGLNNFLYAIMLTRFIYHFNYKEEE